MSTETLCKSNIVNSAAGFNRCSSELQERISNNVASLLRSTMGRLPKRSWRLLRTSRITWHFTRMFEWPPGTALQHLADSLFVNLANLLLICHDSYLEHVKSGIKPHTWSLLRNASVFGYGLFPDFILCTVEQDISKHECWSRSRAWSGCLAVIQLEREF